MSSPSSPGNTETVRTVVVALASNLAIAIAKVGAALITGSTAMMAEAAHALADTGNEALLIVAERRSRRPADVRHPFGYGRDAYFWALIASLCVFVVAASFSLWEGISELLHPSGAASFAVAYAVLFVAVVFDGLSLRRAAHQVRTEARRFHHEFLDHVLITSDPTIRAVFAEDAAAITGDLIVFVALLLRQATGSSIPEGVGAIAVGVLVGMVAVQLARRNHDFLLGQPVPPETRARVERSLLERPAVVSVSELDVTFIGPHRIWVLARIDIDDCLPGREVEELVRSLERDLKNQSPYIVRADIVPIGPPTLDNLAGAPSDGRGERQRAAKRTSGTPTSSAEPATWAKPTEA